MNEKIKILLMWSGGKGSALALNHLKNDPLYEVIGLVSLIEREHNRILYHGVPDTLILEQAKLVKLPLQRVFYNKDNSEDLSTQLMNILKMYKKKNISTIAIGGCENSKVQSLSQILSNCEFNVIYPLANQSSQELTELFFLTGFKAIITSVNINHYPQVEMRDILSKEYTQEIFAEKFKAIDPFSSNDEFHTFVTFGPNFKMRVPFSKSIAVEEDDYLVSLIKEP